MTRKDWSPEEAKLLLRARVERLLEFFDQDVTDQDLILAEFAELIQLGARCHGKEALCKKLAEVCLRRKRFLSGLCAECGEPVEPKEPVEATRHLCGVCEKQCEMSQPPKDNATDLRSSLASFNSSNIQ